jgi:hypothetical protein
MVPCGSLKVAALARQDLAVPTLRMAADHGKFAFRSRRQPNGELTAEDIIVKLGKRKSRA